MGDAKKIERPSDRMSADGYLAVQMHLVFIRESLIGLDLEAFIDCVDEASEQVGSLPEARREKAAQMLAHMRKLAATALTMREVPLKLDSAVIGESKEPT